MSQTKETYDPNPEEEIEIDSIFKHFSPDGDPVPIYQIIDNQLNVMHNRSMSLIQLAGVVITVTGFSGRIIADTNLAAQLCIIIGVSLVLVAAAICLTFVMPIRWITSYMNLPPRIWLLTAIRRRKKKNRAFAIASAVLIVGMVFYITAISIMLLNPEAAELQLVR